MNTDKTLVNKNTLFTNQGVLPITKAFTEFAKTYWDTFRIYFENTEEEACYLTMSVHLILNSSNSNYKGNKSFSIPYNEKTLLNFSLSLDFRRIVCLNETQLM